MIYRDFQDKKISALGMGCMRLPLIDGNEAMIDEAAAAALFDYAMAHGVNYYDTAWGYHVGNSETVTGKLLQKYPRDSYYLASKFPGYDLANMGKAEEIFEAQLKKCGVDYFDFYLFHNVCEMNIDAYLDLQYGTYDYLMKQKAKGRIRHLGFSVHGNLETTKRFLDAYGKGMEFCQIQLNWLDWEFQNARGKMELLKEWGIPVWVMEPVRGGKLINLPKPHMDALQAIAPQRSSAEWAFRFLQGFEDVVVTLSGMTNLVQLQENVRIYETDAPLPEAERTSLLNIAKEMTSAGTVPCTACRYCTTYCPQELNIPRLLELYNEQSYSGKNFLIEMGMSSLPEDKRPAACIGCRSCEAVCPQNIKISEVLAQFAESLK